MDIPTHFYRYKAVEYASLGSDGEYQSKPFPNPSLELETYNLHKETPKGYWIGYGIPDGYQGKPFWVSKTAKKRYAYPTKAEALTNFIKRNELRVKILTRQTMSCKIAIDLAKDLTNKLAF